jgi:hypothetical protein
LRGGGWCKSEAPKLNTDLYSCLFARIQGRIIVPKYVINLRTIVINQKYTRQEIKKRLRQENAWYHSVRKLLHFRVLSKSAREQGAEEES